MHVAVRKSVPLKAKTAAGGLSLSQKSAAYIKKLLCIYDVNANLSLFQQNMDIYRRSKLSEQELEALELREREVSVEMSRWVANGKPTQMIMLSSPYPDTRHSR